MDMIRYLIECGADPTIRDNEGKDARAVATFYNRQSLINELFHEDSPFYRHGTPTKPINVTSTTSTGNKGGEESKVEEGKHHKYSVT